VRVPGELIVTRHTDALRELLDHHGVGYTLIDQPIRRTVRAMRLAARPSALGRFTAMREASTPTTLPAGSLCIDLTQPAGRLALLLLDPRSISSVFRYPDYAAWMAPGEEFFIYQRLR
jgi:hypothetical protein